jgi:hypothetical protein
MLQQPFSSHQCLSLTHPGYKIQHKIYAKRPEATKKVETC